MPINWIAYKGRNYTLPEIAKMEGVVYNTLRRKYVETQNIYMAVKICKEIATRKKTIRERKIEKEERRKEREGRKIEYNGEKLLPSAIARREQIDLQTLLRNLKETDDINEAVRRSKQDLKSKVQKVQYKGKELTIEEIAGIENLDVKDLTRYFNNTKDIYKAVFATRYQKNKEQRIEISGTTIDLYDMSILLGVNFRDLINLLSSGMTIDEVKRRQIGEDSGKKIKFDNKQVLLEFCIEKKKNFTYIYRAVCTYGKTLLEAISESENGNNLIPINWTYEKYGGILNDLGYNGMKSMIIANELRNNNMSLEEAIEMSIIRKNARSYGISVELADVIYTLSRGRKLLGEEFQSEIQVDEAEKAFIKDCEEELAEIKRKMQEDSSSMPKRIIEDDDRIC